MSNIQRANKAQAQVKFDAEALRAGLAPIAEQPLFCVYRLEPNPDKPDKPRKVPYLKGGNRLMGSFSDPALPSKLMPLEAAMTEYYQHDHSGVGVVFYPGCGIVGLDLDHCIDPTGQWSMTPDQKEALAPFAKVSFLEVSQSGTGIHAIAIGNAHTNKANGSVEVFGDKNFLALTGARGMGTASAVGADSLMGVNAVVQRLKSAVVSPKSADIIPVNGVSRATSVRGISDDLIEVAEAPDPQRAASALAAIPSPTDRDEWRNLVWAAKAAGVPFETMLAHSWPGSEQDLINIWVGYDPKRPSGITAGTLYRKALNAGWVDPRPAADVATEELPESEGDRQKVQPTDLWMSKKIVFFFAHEYLYDHSIKAWRVWRGGSWSICNRGDHVERVKALASILMDEAVRQLRADPQSERTKKLMACAMRAQSAHGIETALRLAQSAPQLATGAEEFDKDPDLFNVPNGVIHLPTGELRDHDPAMMLCRQSPVSYDPTATCPQFEAFMLQISCDDPDWVDYMQRSMGYGLSGHVHEEKLFFWLGLGANGKSVLGNLFLYVLGNYGGVAPAAFLMLKRTGDNNGPTPDVANLAGRRMVAANEVEEGSCMSGLTVKTAVSTEAITARHLHSAPFTFNPTHKLVIRGNHRPIIKDNDEGIWRRIDLVPFDLNLPVEARDTGLEDRLMGEAPGILAWMVRGHQKWLRDGLRPARRVRDASLAYRNESDLLAQWVSDCCETGRDAGGEFHAVQKMAYINYRTWCHEQGLRQFAKKSFTRGLKERGFTEGRQGGGDRSETYKGFRLVRGLR